MKLTKSLPVIKERNCTVSFVLDSRTHRRNVTEYPLSLRFTIDRKFFYHTVRTCYTEKQFSDICNATKSASENYKKQKMWRYNYLPKYKDLLENLNVGSPFTYEMVRVAVTTGNVLIAEEKNANVRHHIIRISKEVLGWDENIEPSSTWARHSFANNLRNAGVSMDYISESMGHSGGSNNVTQLYLDNYPLEMQMAYNSKLLNLKSASNSRASLMEKLSALSDDELEKLLASR